MKLHFRIKRIFWLAPYLFHTTDPHPAIVMLHGSGAADRNSENYFPTIRDYFVSQGFAVLCYDKPGIGDSTGDWKQKSFADRADEALTAIKYLRRSPT